jgi:homoserine kinase
MDDNFDAPETSEFDELSFGKEIAKTLVISTATSAGVIAGFVVVGLTISKFNDIKAKRAAKKAAKEDATAEN